MKRLVPAVLLLCLPLLEIALLIRVGQRIGLWPTLGIVVGTAILGVAVLVSQRLAVVSGVMKAVNEGKPPLEPVLDGAFLVLAGGLLFSPGLICDTAGLLLLIPPVRRWVARRSIARLMRDADIHVTVHGEQRVDPGGGGPVIEGEFKRLDDRQALPDGSGERKP
jgi:UPF0716 protein FxsA